MKLLRGWKPVCVPLLLSTLMVGGVIRQFPLPGFFEIDLPSQLTGPTHLTELQKATKPHALPIVSVNDAQGISQEAHLSKTFSSKKLMRQHLTLPGNFRGDWGATPIYTKNDRVNFERGAYLSLTDNNQNQPPAISTGYWRLVKKFKALHEENCFAPMPGLDMGECDFTKSGSLKDMNLQGANLVKAKLNGELGAADLTGANLSGAAVLGSLVIGPDTQMGHANLSYLQSDGNNPVLAENANLSHTNFIKANLYGAKMAHADLSEAKFSEAVLTGSQLASTRFDQADLSKADISYANLSGSVLTKSTMPEVNLEQTDISRADFSDANLQQANLAGSQLAGANFSGTNLRGANFAAAQGADSAIFDTQTDFTFAICPDGITVDGTQVTTCIGHGF